MPHLSVGLDLSLQSPALALRWSDSAVYYVLGFQQRVSDATIHEHMLSPTLCVSRVATDIREVNRWERTRAIVDTLCTYIDKHRQQHVGAPVTVYIEGYAFSSQSSSVSKLCELGGIVRFALFQRGWKHVEICPRTAKKHFGPSGKATKEEMYASYLARGFPSMCTLMGIMPHQHPQEDMIDALAVLMTGLQVDATPRPKKKTPKKRRRVHTDQIFTPPALLDVVPLLLTDTP